MNCERAEALLSAQVDHEIPPADAARLAEHLGECAECRATGEALRAQDRKLRRLYGACEPAAAAVAERVISRIRTLPAPAPRVEVARVARQPDWARPGVGRLVAVAATIGIIAVFLFTHAPKQGRRTPLITPETKAVAALPRPIGQPLASARLAVGQTVRTGEHERRRLELPDGSVAYLNERTAIRLEGERLLALLGGEVFVEVTPRAPDRPGARFVVRAPGRDVTALGTKFSVRAHGGGAGVLVAQGAVQVSGVAGPVRAGQELAPGAGMAAPAARASHLLAWVRDLMTPAESRLVPASRYAGGALIAVDSYGQEAQLSLRKYHIDVHIEDGFARTTIDQTYFNHEWSRLEGTFYFPLPPDAALSRLAMYVGGRLMEGGMAERDHARQVYETIRDTRQDPALLEWVDGSTFKMRVFPLEGRQEKRIILSYTQRLPTLYGRTTYRFPAGHSLQHVDAWSFHARVKGGADVSWSSATHALRDRREGDDLVLDASATNCRTDQDVTLTLEPKEAEPAAEAVRWSSAVHEGWRYLMLRYRPGLATEERSAAAAPRHWVFLFESSGDREPLLARTQIEVIRNLLGQAEHDDTFTVLAAETRVRPFAEGPLPVTPEYVRRAVAFLEGTRLIGALDLGHALEEAGQALKGHANAWLVHVGSGVAAMGERREDGLARRVPDGARYVGVAVGKRWSRGFMKAAAERSGGYFTQINPDEPVSWRAFDVVATLNTPRLQGVQITAGVPGEPVTARPAFLTFASAVAQGEEVAAVVRLGPGQAVPRTVTVSGTLAGRPFARELPVGPVADGADYLPRTWAKLEIDRLLAEDSAKHKAEIVALSKAMYVMTPFTSLLVLETEEMYQQYKVDRGRMDHWAMYQCPERVPVVTEAGPEPAGAKPGERKSEQEVLSTILVRAPAGVLRWPASADPFQGQPFATVQQLLANSVAVPPAVLPYGSYPSAPPPSNPNLWHLRGDDAGLGTSTTWGHGFRLNGPVPPIRGVPLSLYPPPNAVNIPTAPGSPTVTKPGFPGRVSGFAFSRATPDMPNQPAIGGLFNTQGIVEVVPPGPERLFRLESEQHLRRRMEQERGRMPASYEALPELGGIIVQGGQFGGRAGIGGGFGGAGGGGFGGAGFQPFGFSNDFMPKGFVPGLQTPGVPHPNAGYTTSLDIPTVAMTAETPSAFATLVVPYQPPWFGGEERAFTDLVAYAPGMNTSRADILAVVDAEALAPLGSGPGKVEPAARRLIEQARAAGWRQTTVPGTNLTITFNGRGHLAYEHVLPMGLREEVVCDGGTLWHLYPELGVGARRQVSRYHREELRLLVPWLVPPVEDMAQGADLRLVDERTVAVVPAVGSVEIRLMFAPDGRLAERRAVEKPSGKVLGWEVYDADGAVRRLDTAGKVREEQKYRVSATVAPGLLPAARLVGVRRKYVVLPLPLRTAAHVRQVLKIDANQAHAPADAEAAQALLAAEWAGNNTGMVQSLVNQLAGRGVSGVGFCTLLAACGVRDVDATEYWRHPLAEYLAACGNPALRPYGLRVRLSGPPDGFLQRLASFCSLWTRWNKGQAQVGTEPERRAEQDAALEFVRKNTGTPFGWALLRAVQEKAGTDARLWQALAEAYRLFIDTPGLAYAARYERARCLVQAGRRDAGRAAFRDLFKDAVRRGELPAIDRALRDALRGQDKEADEWAPLVRRSVADLVAGKHRLAVVLLGGQCWEFGDQALAGDTVAAALAGTKPGADRVTATLAAIQFFVQTGQAVRADELLRPLLADGKLARSAALWRLGKHVAELRKQTPRAVECLETALALEQKHLPPVIDLQAVRADYGALFGAYQQMADAMTTLGVRPPGGFAARVIAAADRWRALDRENAELCQTAAKILQQVGATDEAWEFLTTPIGLRPNEAGPWLGLAQAERGAGQFDLADRAYRAAFEAEPTNAQVLWDRAQNLQQAGKLTAARELYKQLAGGDWQPRFQNLKAQARWQLDASR